MSNGNTTTTNTLHDALIRKAERFCPEWAKGHHIVRPASRGNFVWEVVLVHPATGDEFPVDYC